MNPLGRPLTNFATPPHFLQAQLAPKYSPFYAAPWRRVPTPSLPTRGLDPVSRTRSFPTVRCLPSMPAPSTSAAGTAQTAAPIARTTPVRSPSITLSIAIANLRGPSGITPLCHNTSTSPHLAPTLVTLTVSLDLATIYVENALFAIVGFDRFVSLVSAVAWWPVWSSSARVEWSSNA